MKENMKITALYRDADASIAYPYLTSFDYPWEALASISDIILKIGSTLSSEEYNRIGEDIWIAKCAKVAPTVSVSGPCIICADAEIRHCAYIRGSAVIGRGAVVGNSTELKNCILFDGVQVPHYNYVGDSILGYKSHMGAGAVTSNVKSDKTPVTVLCDGERVETGRKKFGAMLGDFVEVGCNSVLNPGTVVGAHSNIYPRSVVRGFVPAGHIFKAQDRVVKKH
ncbi:MAG: UDP-N-acetylglucosamine pyrophosphorylase [Clostridia bacterium]|nr:UDP-N-acetylglucosamine pyrophosphorylase [Clostridia bacterium]